VEQLPGYDAFAGCLGERFEASGLTMQLVEATAGSSPEEFSLVFRGPTAPVLEQSIVDLHHDRLGDVGLFLVPIGPDAEGMQYQAVFA